MFLGRKGLVVYSSVDMPLVGGLIALVGLVASGIITWLYLRKAKTLQGDSISQRVKYIQPLVALTVTSLITCCGITLMFVFSASPEIATITAWITGIITGVTCSGFLLIWFMFSYLVNLWWHKQKIKRQKP
jgi:hypothetical protein